MILTLQFYLRKIWKTLNKSVLFTDVWAVGAKHSLALPLIVWGGGGHGPVAPWIRPCLCSFSKFIGGVSEGESAQDTIKILITPDLFSDLTHFLAVAEGRAQISDVNRRPKIWYTKKKPIPIRYLVFLSQISGNFLGI